MKIESKRLILRNWKDEDVEDIVEGLNNKDKKRKQELVVLMKILK